MRGRVVRGGVRDDEDRVGGTSVTGFQPVHLQTYIPRMPRKRPSDPADDIPRARELRQDQTPPEAVFWSRVRNHRLHGLQFRRQHPLGPYTADFYCAEAGLVIELDGSTHEHRVESDRARDAWMRERGIAVLRIAVSRLSKDPGAVVGRVGQIALQRIEERRVRDE